MKKIVPLILLIITCHFSMAQVNQKLIKQIDSLYMVDQDVQQAIITAFQNNLTQRSIDSLEKVKNETYKRHIPILKEMITKNRLPTYQFVGKKSSDNFLVMVNHSFADIAFQKKVIKLANKEIEYNNISGNQIALLTDKMLLKSGKKQIYGTQCSYKNGVAITQPLADEKNVDKRRKKMGLDTLANYLQMMTELHQQMNKKSQ